MLHTTIASHSKSQQVMFRQGGSEAEWSYQNVPAQCPLHWVEWTTRLSHRWTNAGQNNTLNKSQLLDAGMYGFVNMQMYQSIQESHRVHYTVLSPAILWSVKSGSLTERALYNTRLHLIMLNRGSLFLRYMYRGKNSVVWKWIRNVTEVEGPGD